VTEQPFSHVDGTGKLRMVMSPTSAHAEARVRELCGAYRGRRDRTWTAYNELDPVHAARCCIQAAKQTANLIPLCHPLNLNEIHVEVVVNEGAIEISATVTATHRTGVEMEP